MNDVAGFSPSRGPLRDNYENPVFASNNQRSRRSLPAVAADSATKPQQQQQRQQQHEAADTEPSYAHDNPFYEAQDRSRRPSSTNSLLRFVSENAEASTGAAAAALPAPAAAPAIPHRAVRRTSSAAALAARYLNQQRRASAALPGRTNSGLSPDSWQGEGPAAILSGWTRQSRPFLPCPTPCTSFSWNQQM